MNKQQQQNAILKLATVRLAINHVLRSRAMQKKAEPEEYLYGDGGVGAGVPGYGYFAEDATAPGLPHVDDNNITMGNGLFAGNSWNWTHDGREDDPTLRSWVGMARGPEVKGPEPWDINLYQRALWNNQGGVADKYPSLLMQLKKDKRARDAKLAEEEELRLQGRDPNALREAQRKQQELDNKVRSIQNKGTFGF